jgi:ferrochelatase
MNEIPHSTNFRPGAAQHGNGTEHQAAASGRIGILIMNLGTPDGTGYWPLRRYLKEFLSDRRVIETNPLLWWPILNLAILTRRPFLSGKAYKAIWNKEQNESPLLTVTRAQWEKLSSEFARQPRLVVDWAMRYGNPSIKSRLDYLRSQGCDRILLFPLYPQYAAATTATACDKAFDALKEMRWQPSIRVVPPYYDDPAFIDALAVSLRRGLVNLDWEPEAVVASFHGLPVEYVRKGDPYYSHCVRNAQLLREALGWGEDRLLYTFQSRFGRAEWLKPYTAQTIEDLARKGVKRVAVITPGFSADCVETLEEIAIQGAEIFHEHGGEKFAALPCLNDAPESIAMLSGIIRRELSGWIAC